MCHTKFARLHHSGNRSWCARHRAVGEWILVDLGVTALVTGLMTQGREEANEWVTLYTVSFSNDASKWSYVTDSESSVKRKIFSGNFDSNSVRYNIFKVAIEARFIRIHVIEWHGWPSLRLEIVGCQGNLLGTKTT